MCRFLWEEEETALEKKLRASNYTEELVLRLWCLLEHIKLNKKMEGYPPWVSEATSNLIFSLLNASVLVKIRIFSVFRKEFSSLQSAWRSKMSCLHDVLSCQTFNLCYICNQFKKLWRTNSCIESTLLSLPIKGLVMFSC